MLLGLLEQRAQGLGHISQTEVGGLGESLSVPDELTFLEDGRSSCRASRLPIQSGTVADRGHRRPAEERNLLGEHLGVT